MLIFSFKPNALPPFRKQFGTIFEQRPVFHFIFTIFSTFFFKINFSLYLSEFRHSSLFHIRYLSYYVLSTGFMANPVLFYSILWFFFSTFFLSYKSLLYISKPAAKNSCSRSFYSMFFYLLQYGSFSYATTFVIHCARTLYPLSFSSHLFSFPPHLHRYCSGCFVSWEARNRLISSPHFSHRKMYR